MERQPVMGRHDGCSWGLPVLVLTARSTKVLLPLPGLSLPKLPLPLSCSFPLPHLPFPLLGYLPLPLLLCTLLLLHSLLYHFLLLLH